MADDRDDGIPSTPEEKARANKELEDERRRFNVIEGGKPAAKPANKPKPKGKGKGNVNLLREELRNNDDVKDLIAYDTFTDRIVRLKPVPGMWNQREGTTPWRGAHDAGLLAWFQANGFPQLGMDTLRHALDARAEEKQFSIVETWLDSIDDDGGRPIRNFFRIGCGVDTTEKGGSVQDMLDYARYLRELAQVLFVGIVARIRDPGCQFDYMVILESTQGTQKSSFCRILAIKDEWFSDRLPREINNPEALKHLKGKLVIEIAELSAMKTNRIEDVKSITTGRTFSVRNTYGRHEEFYRRQGVFIGTTNESCDYLYDTTGNRRFFPVACGNLDLDWIRANINQLYAEARRLYDDEGVRPILSQWAVDYAKREVAGREVTDTWEDDIAALVDERKRKALYSGKPEAWVSIKDCFEIALFILERVQQTPERQKRISKILTKLGGKKRQRQHYSSKYSWVHVFETGV